MSEIVVFGHPSLTTKSVNVENIDDYIVSLTKKMIQIMYDAPGVGLAAPQIGINKNIFVFDAGDGPKVAINPKIEDLQGSVVFMEGCLSLPGYYWDIERYEYAKLTCLNQNGEEIDYLKVTTEGPKSKSFAYCSDTAYFDKLADYIKCVDLLLSLIHISEPTRPC